MLGVLLAVLTATLWGCSGFLGAVSARRVGGVAAAFWTYPIGLVIVLPIAIATGAPDDPVSRGTLYGAAGGALSVVGLALAFRAGAEGHAGLASSVVALEGAWSALIAVALLGESIDPRALVFLAVMAAGFLLLARRDPAGGSLLRSLGFALLSGVCFGFATNGFAAGAEAIGPYWQTVLIRIVGSAIVLVMLAGRQIPSPRRAIVPVAVIATAEVVATITFLLAADRAGVGVAAVIASQFALVVLVLGWLFLKERLTRRQALGAALICAGVAAFTAIQS